MSDDTPPRVVWADRTGLTMHDVAEALGIDSDLVMAVHEQGERKLSAFYTPRYDQGDKTIWLALLRRNRDGTLRVVSRERKPGMWEQIRRGLGEPDA